MNKSKYMKTTKKTILTEEQQKVLNMRSGWHHHKGVAEMNDDQFLKWHACLMDAFKLEKYARSIITPTWEDVDSEHSTNRSLIYGVKSEIMDGHGFDFETAKNYIDDMVGSEVVKKTIYITAHLPESPAIQLTVDNYYSYRIGVGLIKSAMKNHFGANRFVDGVDWSPGYGGTYGIISASGNFYINSDDANIMQCMGSQNVN